MEGGQESRQNGTLDMTSGSPAKLLLLFAVPVILSNLFQQLYNLIDSLIVGNYLGADALAAVGSAGTVTSVMIQLASGLALGASVVIAQYFGAGKKEEIRICMTTISLFSAAVGALVTVLALLSARQILILIKTPLELMDDSVGYLHIYFWGSMAIFLYNALNVVYIAMGDSRTPLYFLILAFFLNVGGDLFFIVVCSMGVEGGALASTLSQAVCTVLSFVVLERKLQRLGMGKAGKLFDPAEFVRMMQIALPAALQQSVVSLGSVCVQAVTNSFGPAVMAGCAAANKAVNLISMIPINWGNALSGFAGQNIGAGKPERIRQGVKASLWAVCSISAVMVLWLEWMPETIIGWFVGGEEALEVVSAGASYLRAVGLSLVIFSAYMVLKSVFKGTGDMAWFVFLTLSSLGIRVFCVYALKPVFGKSILWWSVVAGWVISFIPTVLHYRSGKWEKGGLF